jgi:hypothetical protein
MEVSSDLLKDLGIPVLAQFGSDNLEIHLEVISADNPEVQKARFVPELGESISVIMYIQ